jgi:hypothetical protein
MRGLALLLLVALSGCITAQDAPADSSEQASDRASRPGVQDELEGRIAWLNQSYQLVNSQSKLEELSNYEPGNCLLLSGGGSVLRGNATVQWTSEPGTPTMDLLAVDRGQIAATATGDGTASISFDGLPLPTKQGDTAISWEISKSVPAGATNQLHGTLTVALLVEGNMKVEEGYGCTYNR